MPTVTLSASEVLETSLPAVIVFDDPFIGDFDLDLGTVNQALAKAGFTPDEVEITGIRFYYDVEAVSSDSSFAGVTFGDFSDGDAESSGDPHVLASSFVVLSEDLLDYAFIGASLSGSNNECDLNICPFTVTVNAGTRIEVDYLPPAESAFWTDLVNVRAST